MSFSLTGAVRRGWLRPAARLVLFAAAASGALATGAEATNYYACECASGSEAGCVPGNDSAAGTNPASAWRSWDRLQSAVAGSQCGDTFNFCEGGVFDPRAGSEWTVANQNCSANRRIVRSYDPGNFSRRPRIQGDETLFALHATGAQGITISGLDLVCTGACDAGVGAILGNVDDVVVDDMIVDGFNVCVQWGTNKRMGIQNSIIRNCKSQGLIGPAGSGSYVIDSEILHSGCLETTDQSVCAFQHAHYWNVSGPEVSNLLVRGNRYEDNVLAGGSGACLGNQFVIRGGTNTVIEDNTFVTPATGGGPAPTCQNVRLSTSQPQQRCVGCTFRGNRVFGGAGLVGVESWIGGVLENNLLYSPVSSGQGPKAAISLNASANGAVAADGVTIRNNSIVMGSSGGPPAAGIGVFAALGTNPHRIAGNAIRMIGNGSSDVCLRFISDSIAATVLEDYNVCGRVNPSAAFAATGTRLTLSAWRSSTGQGLHSLEADPAFAAATPPGFDFSIGSSSPAVDAGDPANAPVTDVVGAARPVGAAPDAGGYEYGATTPQVPLPPILR